MGICINGKDLAKKYKDKIKSFIEKIKDENSRIPCIATISRRK